MTAIEQDEHVQKKGFIAIGYRIGCDQGDPTFFETFKHMPILTEALPFRTVAVHFCYEHSQLRPLALLIQNAINAVDRLRFRVHFGK